MTTSMPYPYDRRNAEIFLDNVDRRDPDIEEVFAIDLGGELIGVIGFSPAEFSQPEVGYWLGRPYWGRGFATEATKAALTWASEDWRRRVVVAGHFADNAASGEVLVKAGFLYTGEIQMRRSAARDDQPTPTRMMVWLP
jgi:RimJ/RimL family protein N-acetyltransferase